MDAPDKELVERLIEGPQAGCANLPGWEELAAEAASRLQSLSTESQRLREERDAAQREAVSLATWLHRNYYSDVTQWRPFDDPAGVLTQIDSMVAGLADRAQAAEAQVKRLEEEREEICEAIAGCVCCPEEEYDALRASEAKLAPLRELAEKYKWQVRDTCVRAERSEADRDLWKAKYTRLGDEVVGVRAGYASQAKFADHEPASYFREFVRRLDALLSRLTEQQEDDHGR